ncbi:helix-turn-helix domain-containing protein [Nostoc sp.]|uniref:helix-turn-helix domain-containing protein n=1 Tax=Nostoc sp. TaxID=1180 RepID=UPI002FF9BEAA
MHQLSNMRLLKIRELAEEKAWTLKEISDHYGVINSTVRSYTRRLGMTTVDFTAIHRLAHTFDVTIEDLVEILEE